MKNVRLDVTVDETDIGSIQAGQKATITFDSISGKTFQGQVTGVAPSATITSGVATYQVFITIGNPTGIKPGMTGNASIVVGEKTNALMVPNRAVKAQGTSRVVQVVSGATTETRQDRFDDRGHPGPLGGREGSGRRDDHREHHRPGSARRHWDNRG